jgi:hypothetical protein
MTPNPLLKKLGFADDDRVVIIHVDDVGMCHASLQAFADLWDAGRLQQRGDPSRGSLRAGQRPPRRRLGVHGTVNAEWDTAGGRSARDRATGLMDASIPRPRDGRLGRSRRRGAGRDRRQVEQALAAGIDVTHRHHMGTITHPLHRRLPANAAALPAARADPAVERQAVPD